MERAKAVHTIMVEMTTGMLVLVTLAVLILASLSVFGRDRHARLADSADAVALFGLTFGTLMIFLSILSGFRQWPLEAFLHGAIVQNKIFASAMALSFWAGLLFFRLAAGKRLWKQRALALFALVLALAGFVFLVFAASIGGTLAGKPSGFEEVIRGFVETRQTFSLPWAGNLLLLSAGVALPFIGFFWSKRQAS